MYAGSVKNIYSTDSVSNLIFEFTDDYSVFDWGKMPDAIPRKGEALAKLMPSFLSAWKVAVLKLTIVDLTVVVVF